MCRLSVNINKVALIRNARGQNKPNLLKVAADCEAFGADGITVHPRPDQRHIRYDDIMPLNKVVTTEFNIEGNPTPDFMKLVTDCKPHQCTLVPDAPDALTSDEGWDIRKHQGLLTDITGKLHEHDIRVSVFVNARPEMMHYAAAAGIDRIELYTGPYAHEYEQDRNEAIRPYIETAQAASELGIGINAGHDLNLRNLRWLNAKLPRLDEVSIGHALICDALYFGLENTISMYKRCLAQ